MDLFTMYLIASLDSIHVLFVCLSVIITLILTIYYGTAVDTYKKEERKVKFQQANYVAKILAPILLVLLVVATMTPSTKQAVTMLGIHELMQNEEANKLPNNLLKTINTYLEGMQESSDVKTSDK